MKEDIIKSTKQLSWTTHSSFLERVQSGNELAWSEFYDKYALMIRRIGSLRGLTAVDCDDLMIDVMVIFWKKMDSFIYDRTKGNFRSYLGRIADFCSLKIMRNKRKARVPFNKNLLSYPDDIDEKWMDEWRDFLLEKAMEDLKNSVDTEVWQVFYMSFVQERSVKEISETTRKTPNNIYVINSRCTAKLKNLIAHYRLMEESELLNHSSKNNLES